MGSLEALSETLRQLAIAFFTGLLKTITEHLLLILTFTLFIIASRIFETARLVMGKAPS